jgi:hypothetical protein
VIPPDIRAEELCEVAEVRVGALATPATAFAILHPADTRRAALTQTKFQGRIQK